MKKARRIQLLATAAFAIPHGASAADFDIPAGD
jgi:hypothetical protein